MRTLSITPICVHFHFIWQSSILRAYFKADSLRNWNFLFEVHRSTLKEKRVQERSILNSCLIWWALTFFPLSKIVLYFSQGKKIVFLFFCGQLTLERVAKEKKGKKLRENTQISGVLTPSGEILYLNFLSYADLYLDCCVSLILKSFLSNNSGELCMVWRAASMYIRRVAARLWALEHPTGRSHLFLFSRYEVRICGTVYKIIFYFMKIFLYSRI